MKNEVYNYVTSFGTLVGLLLRRTLQGSVRYLAFDLTLHLLHLEGERCSITNPNNNSAISFLEYIQANNESITLNHPAAAGTGGLQL